MVKKPAKKKPTIRERIEGKEAPKKDSKSSPSKSDRIKRPLSKAKTVGKKEYHLPLPNNKIGKILGKRGKLVPSYFKESWAELKLVTWPNRSETVRLTTAVFIFSIIFGVVVALLDVGLDKIFKEIIIK